MKSLVKKELTEISVLAGLAFLAVTCAWIASVRFWEALLPPATEQLLVVGLTAALAGGVLGYLQFSVDRWTGKQGYLAHRGTGIDGAFAAKAIAGLAGTALVALGPPLVYAALTAASSPNRSIAQWSILGEYAVASSCGASLYGLGALGASLRRRALVGILALVVGAAGLYLLSETVGAPWGSAPELTAFLAVNLVSAAVLLLATRAAFRRSADADLPLPRGVHLTLAALAVPLVLAPADLGGSAFRDWMLAEAREGAVRIVRDRSTKELLTVVPGETGGFFRLTPEGARGERVEIDAQPEAKDGYETVYWWNGGTWLGASADAPPRLDPRRLDPMLTQGQLLRITTEVLRGVETMAYLPNGQHEARVYLDRSRGVVRAFGFLSGASPAPVEGRRQLPFALELGKPGVDVARFSEGTVVLRAANDPLQARVRSGDFAKDPRIHVLLADPSDPSLWRVDILDSREPIRRVELPDGDRFVRLEERWFRGPLAFGHYRPSWAGPLIVGERGAYEWDGVEIVEAVPSENHATTSEAPGLLELRVVLDDPDPLRTRVRVLDARDGSERFVLDCAPIERDRLAAATAQATVLLNAPVWNALEFSGTIRRANAPDDSGPALVGLLHGGRRPWLMALDAALALACAWLCARMLRRRSAPTALVAVWSILALLFGPVALLVAWALEPRGVAKERAEVAAATEPVLAIRSA